MTHKKNIAALYRAVAGLPVEKQRETCHTLAKRLGMRIDAEYNADEDDSALREWRKGLKSTDVAMVANLTCIPDWRTKGAKPGPVLAETLTDLASRGVMLVSALDELSSAEGAKWVAIVRQAHDALSLGARKQPRKHYKMMSAKSRGPGSKRQPSVVKRWNAKPQVRDRWASHWRAPKFSSAREAFEAMPDDVKSDIGSLESARRVFGERKPGDKSAGGRPRKIKPARKRKS